MIDEMIVLAIDLARAPRTGGVGDRERQRKITLEQRGNEAGLTGSRRRRDDEQETFGRWERGRGDCGHGVSYADRDAAVWNDG